MSDTSLRLVVIIGSTRQGRFGPTVGAWFVDQARRHSGMDVDVVDLAETRLPEVVSPFDPAPPAEVAALGERLAAADGFVVITPEYNRSVPASLKNAIDWYQRQWHAKPVGFVSYGGVSGGLRAVEHLRLIFAELHAVTVRDTVSFPQAWERFDESGRPTEPAGCEAAAKKLLDQLAWWAHALRDARNARPYTA